MLQTIYLETHLQEIADHGWSVLPIDHQWAQSLAEIARARQKQNEFKTASLAGSAELQLTIRNDQTLWLDAKLNDQLKIEQETLSKLADLQQQLQNFFRIHLSEFECHYAYYETGHFYQRHFDSTEFNNKRIFSFVIYLNDKWQAHDAGELVGYIGQKELFRLPPQIGKMILFRSDIEHEVMPTNRPRWSVTGWFRK
ncbi:MAG: 2OG-Fe(II) oxygenase [Bdellovibrionaceae bacterium]|nr:2OG-Fe(II) oxygenase [Bdellovibrio sp.]